MKGHSVQIFFEWSLSACIAESVVLQHRSETTKLPWFCFYNLPLSFIKLVQRHLGQTITHPFRFFSDALFSNAKGWKKCSQGRRMNDPAISKYFVAICSSYKLDQQWENSVLYVGKKKGDSVRLLKNGYFSSTLKKVYDKIKLLIPSHFGSVSNSGSM